MAGGRHDKDRTLRFKKRFRSINVEIDGQAEAVHRFETVPLTRSGEKQLGEVLERGIELDPEELPDGVEVDEAMIDLFLDTIDLLIKPPKGKKTPASKVLKELWLAEEIESGDVVDFLTDLAANRRPT